MKVHVIYDADGTKELHIDGHRVSTQLWSSGKALIQVFDAADLPVRTVQLRRCYLIDKAHDPKVDP